jgi:hypothetical protein
MEQLFCFAFFMFCKTNKRGKIGNPTKVSAISSTIKLAGGIQAKMANQFVSNSIMGTCVWKQKQFYRGGLKIYANSSSSTAVVQTESCHKSSLLKKSKHQKS